MRSLVLGGFWDLQNHFCIGQRPTGVRDGGLAATRLPWTGCEWCGFEEQGNMFPSLALDHIVLTFKLHGRAEGTA
jgi:hypothetical protein